MKEFKLSTIDKLEQSVYLWDDVKKPKAVIQLVHGSAERMNRYDAFAKEMNKNGFIVIGDDHRGHGKTAIDNNLPFGYFAKHNGWKKLIDDELNVNAWTKKQWLDLPIFMLGHSMGSFMALDYAIKYAKTIDGLIISGTTDRSYVEEIAAIALSGFDQLIYGPKHTDKLVWDLSFKPFNKKWAKQPNSTGSEWQTQNKEVKDAFVNDPSCGQPFTTSGYKDMFRGILFVKSKRHLKLIDKDLPILIISGKDDSMGRYGNGPKKVYDKLISLGDSVEMKLYPDQRHEILFEPKHNEVEQDVVDFINKYAN